MARHPFRAVNLISDPIHGYLELTCIVISGAALSLPLRDAAANIE